MKRIVVIVCFMLLGSTVFSQHSDSKHGIKFVEGKSWEKILKMSAKKKKLIFLDCFTSWCGPCKGLAKDIFTQKKVGKFFNANFINTHYDMEKGEGKILYKKYKKYIIGFPTLLLIDHSGKVLHQMAGYQKADALINGMKDGLEGKSLFALKERYDNGERGFDFLKSYVVALEGAFLKDQISKVMSDYMHNLPLEKLKEKEIWDFVKDHITDPYSKEFRYVFENIGYYKRKLNVDRYDLEWKLGWQVRKAVKEIVEPKKDDLKAYPEKQEMLMALLNKGILKESKEMIAMLAIHNSKVDNNVPKVFEQLNCSLDFGMFSSRSSFFIETVRFIVSHGTDKEMIDTCFKWIYDIQTSKESQRFMVNYYDLLALIYEKQGKTEKCKEAKAKYKEIEDMKMKKYLDLKKKK